MKKVTLMVRLENEQRAFNAGYRAGFSKEIVGIFVPSMYVRFADKYRAGFKAGQFDYKVEKV